MRISNWRERVVECRSRGMSAKAWCEQAGIKYTRYMSWASRYNREEKQPESKWAEITVSPSPSIADSEVKIVCNKWTVVVSPGFDPSLLTDVLKTVSSIC